MVWATGFGGLAGQIAILHRDVVERRQWLDEEEFLAALLAGRASTPVVVAIAAAIGVLASVIR